MAWLFDTNVLSELRKPRPDPRVVHFISNCKYTEMYVSTVVLAELRFGIETFTNPVQRVALQSFLDQIVRPMFDGRVLGITEDIILRWRLMVDDGRKSGRTFFQPDLFLAATALHHNLTLVTRNVRDFTGLHLPILNPWDTP